jgi:hypothetical protein
MSEAQLKLFEQLLKNNET